MPKYVLQKTEFPYNYVKESKAGGNSSYTNDMFKARIFDTRLEAEKERCPNERVVPVKPPWM